MILASLVNSWLRMRGQPGILICCSRRAMVWCVLDNLAHLAYRYRLILRRRTGWRWLCPTVPHELSWICRKHDQAITGEEYES